MKARSESVKTSDPDDFAIVLAGLAKLRNRQRHREPLTKPLGEGLFELRHVGKLNTRVLWFFMKDRPLATRPRPQTEYDGATDHRLESPDCEGHSLSMLRRVAKALRARVRVVLEPDSADKTHALAEEAVSYRHKRPIKPA